jgi:hypothetical protein
MSAGERHWRAELFEYTLPQRQIAQVLIASAIFAFGLAIFLLVRRATGALGSPLPPLPLVATAIGLLVWVWGTRLVWGWHAARATVFPPQLERAIALWLPHLTLMVFAVACSYPGRRLVDWLVWLPVVVVNSIGPHLLDRWQGLRKSQIVQGAPAKQESVAPTFEAPSVSMDNTGTMLQQLNRSRTADGRHAMHGQLVAEFGPGERMATLHVAFCPPFEFLPYVEVEVSDGPDASVKVAQVLHNGARIEVRLSEPAVLPTAVSIEFAAAEMDAE